MSDNKKKDNDLTLHPEQLDYVTGGVDVLQNDDIPYEHKEDDRPIPAKGKKNPGKA